MNCFFKFPNNDPGDEPLHIYWDHKAKRWEVWFGEDLRMFGDENYNRFEGKLIQYKRVKENSE